MRLLLEESEFVPTLTCSSVELIRGAHELGPWVKSLLGSKSNIPVQRKKNPPKIGWTLTLCLGKGGAGRGELILPSLI